PIVKHIDRGLCIPLDIAMAADLVTIVHVIRGISPLFQVIRRWVKMQRRDDRRNGNCWINPLKMTVFREKPGLDFHDRKNEIDNNWFCSYIQWQVSFQLRNLC